MNNYLILVRGTYPGFSKLDEAGQGAIYQKWGTYMEKLTASGNWTGGAPLEHSGRLFCEERQAKEGLVGDHDVSVEGYMMLQAESYDAAIKLCDDCPSLEIGGKLEIREVINCEG